MKMVMIRHGESTANQANVFTGWMDVDLSENGVKQAQMAGQKLKELAIPFDTVYTSVLKRAIKTAHIVMEESDNLYLPIKKSWRLNERHYGALQGLNKAETAEKYGDAQVHIWRRSYKTKPPYLPELTTDKKYDKLDPEILPHCESLYDTLQRVLPYWQDELAPKILSGQNILVVAHGNSLRSLAKHIEQIDDENITQLEIGTGQVIAYDFDSDLQLLAKVVY